MQMPSILTNNLFVREVLEADMKIGVSFALLQGQLLAGEISRSAFLERASPEAPARAAPTGQTQGELA